MKNIHALLLKEGNTIHTKNLAKVGVLHSLISGFRGVVNDIDIRFSFYAAYDGSFIRKCRDTYNFYLQGSNSSLIV
jgi:heat shock protein HspQ